jgi:hypothetical protein
MDGSKGAEYGAEALYKVNDAQARVEALEQKIVHLEEQNRVLQDACAANALALAGTTTPPAGPSTSELGLETMASRLEARIEAYTTA